MTMLLDAQIHIRIGGRSAHTCLDNSPSSSIVLCQTASHLDLADDAFGIFFIDGIGIGSQDSLDFFSKVGGSQGSGKVLASQISHFLLCALRPLGEKGFAGNLAAPGSSTPRPRKKTRHAQTSRSVDVKRG